MLDTKTFPKTLTLTPKTAIDASLAVVGSKSLTNRAAIIAALAEGTSVLTGSLIAEDTDVMLKALRDLGIAASAQGDTFTIAGQGGHIPAGSATLDLRLSGTSIRFLSALVALGQGHYRLDGTKRMRERPIGDLLAALNALGAHTYSEFQNDCPPIVIEAQGLEGGHASIAGDRSSQYLSALLMVAPYARQPVTLAVTGELQSKPFIDMTVNLMADFGVELERDGYNTFQLTPSRYRAQPYQIEGDAMAAGYFWAGAAITGGRVRVTNVGSRSCQGDRRLADVLGSMGCSVNWSAESCEVIAPSDGRLRGGTFDLNDMSDQAQTLAVVALFAESPVRIENVWNMRIKETDRLHALSVELRKLGALVEEGHDFIVIHPLTQAQAAQIATYGDHRMAMAFALAGLKLPGVTICDPACVTKTFPDYFDILQAL